MGGSDSRRAIVVVVRMCFNTDFSVFECFQIPSKNDTISSLKNNRVFGARDQAFLRASARARLLLQILAGILSPLFCQLRSHRVGVGQASSTTASTALRKILKFVFKNNGEGIATRRTSARVPKCAQKTRSQRLVMVRVRKHYGESSLERC